MTLRRFTAGLLVIVCLLGCFGVAHGEQSNNRATLSIDWDTELGYELSDFLVDLKLWGNEKDIEWADALCNGNLYVDIALTEPLPYSMDTFDWNQEATNSPSTFQLYLQSLGMIKFLSRAALMTGESKYLDCASQFIHSWSAYLHSEQSANNPKVWYDHGTALRAENIIYYLLVANELDVLAAEEKEFAYNLLLEHGEFLSQDANYTKNHNHGIYQDEALLYIAYFLPDSEQTNQWRMTAQRRLKEQLAYAFTDEWVHVENSASYCIGVITLFSSIADFLEQMQDSFADELRQNVNMMADFVARIHMPSGKMATLGDSFSGGVSSAQDENFGNSFLAYMQSQGENGEPPASLTAYYPHSGYFFTNETYDKTRLNDSTWLMFKAGYVSPTHKHADDLEILLYSKGYEIFIDPGMYNYMTGNAYRDYLISPRAHNTINVDGKTYSTTAENALKTGLLTYENNDLYQYVLGYNEQYAGVQIDRHVYSANDAILIFDDIRSDEEHVYSQLFQLSDDLRLIEESDHEIVFGLGDTSYVVRIRQLDTPSISHEVIRGGDEENFYGYASNTLNEIHEISTLKFEAKGKDVRFVTLITIEDAQGNIKLSTDEHSVERYATSDTCRFLRDEDAVQIGDLTIYLQPRTRINPLEAIWTVDDATLKIQMPYEKGEGIYTYYLIERETGVVLEKGSWTDETEISISLPDVPVLVKLYTQDLFSQRRNAVIGSWDVGNETTVFQDATKLNYQHLEDSIILQEDGSYRFIAGMDFALDYTLRWYVYRNGSYYTVKNTHNENCFEMIFDAPGSYTTSYYIRTQNGEYEYWTFPEIIIP